MTNNDVDEDTIPSATPQMRHLGYADPRTKQALGQQADVIESLVAAIHLDVA